MAATVSPQFYTTAAGAVPPEQHIHIEAAADESSQFTLTSFLGENLNQWSIVFVIFMVEILMCTAIVVPGPISFRRQFMNQLAKLWNEYPRFRLVTKTVMVRPLTQPSATHLPLLAAQPLTPSFSTAVHHRRLLLGRPQATVHALRRHFCLRHHRQPGSRTYRAGPFYSCFSWVDGSLTEKYRRAPPATPSTRTPTSASTRLNVTPTCAAPPVRLLHHLTFMSNGRHFFWT